MNTTVSLSLFAGNIYYHILSVSSPKLYLHLNHVVVGCKKKKKKSEDMSGFSCSHVFSSPMQCVIGRQKEHI